MYHGEDLAKAHAAIGGARDGGVLGAGVASNARAIGSSNVRQTTVPGLVSQAIDTTNFARDRLESLEALSNRAAALATRLTGPLPVPGEDPAGPATVEKERQPAAALEALGLCIGDIRRPLAAMNDPFQRLVVALNAIEEALA